MPVRFPRAKPRRAHFVAAWRKHCGWTQDRLAERLGISKSSISRIEHGHQPYSQDFLQACADLFGCEPADIISRDPAEPEDVWSAWQAVPNGDRPRVLAAIK